MTESNEFEKLLLDRCSALGTHVVLDKAMLRPAFHYVSICITLPDGKVLGYCSKPFPNYDKCYKYLLGNITILARTIARLTKVVS